MEKYKDKWWYSTTTIMIAAALSVLIVPLILAIVLLIVQVKKRKELYEKLGSDEKINKAIKEKESVLERLEQQIKSDEERIEANKEVLDDQNSYIAGLRNDFEKETAKELEQLITKTKSEQEEVLSRIKNEQQAMLERTKIEQEAALKQTKIEQQEKLDNAEAEAKEIVREANESLTEVIEKTTEYKADIENYSEEYSKLVKEVNRYRTQARKFKSEVQGLKNFEQRFPHSINFEDVENDIDGLNAELAEDTLLGTVINLHLHSDNSKELKRLSNATKKEIKNVLDKYADRYNTKANKTIYNLMTIALQAEIQILLYQLRYNNIEESEEAVKDIITKYLALCASGNQSILPTITKFLTEIEPLYRELIQIEYKYYVYREKEKEEQRMLREQMKQEAEEKKRLAEEKKKLEQEEKKFTIEMERNRKLLEEEKDDEKIIQLQERLKELELQVEGIDEKKEEIASLTLGKAGYVYIISNLGSFGEQMFKIGMTRRMEPQERVDELGSASVPFKFDVHAMVFSNDAVGLESELHKLLNKERVNKVNYRKEFFNTDIERIKELVEEIDPTVEFTTTMLAEEYRQSQSIKKAEMAI